MNRFVPLLALLALFVSGCDFSPARAYCAKLDECTDSQNTNGANNDSDKGKDDVAVCAAQSQATINAFRANDEPECQDIADAYEDILSCSATLECAELLSPSNCEAEYKAFNTLLAKDDGVTCETSGF